METAAFYFVYRMIALFLVYSFLGWCAEVAFQAVTEGLVVNRGFLNGPVCPIYGFGMIAVLTLLGLSATGDTQKISAVYIFAGGIVLATAIELFGGWALDRIFHARWWDYSDKPFNFHGYICLEFSLIWGFGAIFVIRFVHPLVDSLISSVTVTAGCLIMAVLCLIYAADLTVSVLVMAGLNKRLAELDELRAKMRLLSDGLSETIGSGALETVQRVDEARVQASLARMELRDNLDEAREDLARRGAQNRRELSDRLEEYREDLRRRRTELEKRQRELAGFLKSSRHFGAGRLLRAFPGMEHRDYKELLEELRKELRRSF